MTVLRSLAHSLAVADIRGMTLQYWGNGSLKNNEYNLLNAVIVALYMNTFLNLLGKDGKPIHVLLEPGGLGEQSPPKHKKNIQIVFQFFLCTQTHAFVINTDRYLWTYRVGRYRFPRSATASFNRRGLSPWNILSPWRDKLTLLSC